MNPDEITDQQDEEQIDLATVDWKERRDLAGDAAYFLRKEADREWARGTLADTVETAGAHYTQSKGMQAEAEDIENNAWDTSSLKPEVRTKLQDVAPGLVDEIQRREAEATAERAERERIEAMTEEQKATEARAQAEFDAAQAREDALEELARQTQEALNAPDVFAQKRSVTIFADEDGNRMTSVSEVGDDGEVTSSRGLGPARRYESSLHRASREGAGLFGIKRLADQVRDLPPAARAAFWSARSPVELDALSRGFGLRPAVSDKELQEGSV
jgi:anti-sigma regulatory factor (Ser/Thr protein kinase)